MLTLCDKLHRFIMVKQFKSTIKWSSLYEIGSGVDAIKNCMRCTSLFLANDYYKCKIIRIHFLVRYFKLFYERNHVR
jgi:hypothetical protein